MSIVAGGERTFLNPCKRSHFLKNLPCFCGKPKPALTYNTDASFLAQDVVAVQRDLNPPIALQAVGIMVDQSEFVRLISMHHRKLLGYICSLVGRREDAEDVLQRASIVMWQKFDTFESGTDFLAWASTFAFYESKNFLRLANRGKLLFDDQLLDMLAYQRKSDLDQQAVRLEAIEDCVKELDARNRDLILRAYTEPSTVPDIAAELRLAPSTVYNRLCLVRKMLAECVRRKISQGGLA